MKEQKLVITGMGAVTPIGIGVDAYWSALVEGQCGVGKITRFDASELPVQIAAELKDFDPAAYMPKTLARTMDPFMQFAFVAAEEALKDSELSIESESDRIGIVMGTAMDGVTTVAQTQAAFDTGKRVGPRFVPMTIGNIAAAQISIAHGIHGPSLTLNTACSAGGDAIMTAAMLLRSGEADAVLAVGGESILGPIVVSGLSQAKALSRRNDDPEQACRPFDLDRDGFVIGEGGGALLIETEEHALARGAKIHAVLAGYANTSDAHHVTAPCPDGEGASRCMKLALKRAGMQPSDIGYINAHGTSTPLGDKAETLAVKAVFGNLAVDERNRARDRVLQANVLNHHQIAAADTAAYIQLAVRTQRQIDSRVLQIAAHIAIRITDADDRAERAVALDLHGHGAVLDLELAAHDGSRGQRSSEGCGSQRRGIVDFVCTLDQLGRAGCTNLDARVTGDRAK